MIKVLAEAGLDKEAMYWMKEGERLGYSPSRKVYNNLMACYARQGQWKECVSLFEEMKTAGIKPNQMR